MPSCRAALDRGDLHLDANAYGLRRLAVQPVASGPRSGASDLPKRRLTAGRRERGIEGLGNGASPRQSFADFKGTDSSARPGAEDAVRRAWIVAKRRQITLDAADPLAGERWVWGR